MKTRLRPNNSSRAAFSLVEVIIATACASIIFGAILMASVALQRTFKSTESYAGLHSSNQRLLDYLASDLRSAVAIGARNDSTNTVATLSPSNSWISLLSGTTFVIKKVTVYKSSDRSSISYPSPWELRATSSGLAYCTSTAVPPRTVIEYFRNDIGSNQYIVRRETAPSLAADGSITSVSTTDVIYPDSTEMDVDLTLTGSNYGAVSIDVYYPNQFSRSGVVETGAISGHGTDPVIQRSWGVVCSDNIMIRNPREDL